MMNDNKSLPSINSHTKPLHVVFVGGGHASVQVMKHLGEQLPSLLSSASSSSAGSNLPVRITLINEYPYAVYSGMIPGVISGYYEPKSAMFDMGRGFGKFFASQKMDFQFLCARATNIDWKNRQVVCNDTRKELSFFSSLLSDADRTTDETLMTNSQHLDEQDVLRVSFDLICIDIGSTSRYQAVGAEKFSIATRPIAMLPYKIAAYEQQLWEQLKKDGKLLSREEWETFSSEERKSKWIVVSVCIVGAGAAGIELLATLKHRLCHSFKQHRHHMKFSFTMIDSHANFEESLQDTEMGKRVQDWMLSENVKTLFNSRVLEVKPNKIVLNYARSLDFHLLVWACGASPPQFLSQVGLKLDKHGYLQVNGNLQSVENPYVFGAGDCISIEGYPNLPKAGVYAVREGPILSHNIMAVLKQFIQQYDKNSRDQVPSIETALIHSKKMMKQYVPQSNFLKLLNIGNGTAIASWKGFSVGPNTYSFWLKDYIDRKFMDSFPFLKLQ